MRGRERGRGWREGTALILGPGRKGWVGGDREVYCLRYLVSFFPSPVGLDVNTPLLLPRPPCPCLGMARAPSQGTATSAVPCASSSVGLWA